jgi:hypothetical protein
VDEVEVSWVVVTVVLDGSIDVEGIVLDDMMTCPARLIPSFEKLDGYKNKNTPMRVIAIKIAIRWRFICGILEDISYTLFARHNNKCPLG